MCRPHPQQQQPQHGRRRRGLISSLHLRLLLAILVLAIILPLHTTTSVHARKDKHHEKERTHDHHSHEEEPTSASDQSSSSSPPTPGAATLVSVQIVSRHGTRAPNPVVDKLCPSDRSNLALYGHLRISLAGLTGTGMRELYALGVWARQAYIHRIGAGKDAKPFLSSYFNDEEVYFRAVGEDRTIQSAVVMGQAMYPAGSSAVGYDPTVPSPIPVYTLPNDYDSLLEVRKHDCAARLKEDGARWDATKGVELYAKHAPLLQRLNEMCNITDLHAQVQGTKDNYGDAIKDITDAWTFDMIEGFPPVPGLNYSTLLDFRQLAIKQLLGRILGTPEQVTYLNGQLPERLVANFEKSIWSQGPVVRAALSPHKTSPSLKFYAYHGHREMMYALGAFLGIEFDIDFPGLPKGAIPPATTLIFELHYIGNRTQSGGIPDAFQTIGRPNPYVQRLVPRSQLPPPQPGFGEGLPVEMEGQQTTPSSQAPSTQPLPPTSENPLNTDVPSSAGSLDNDPLVRIPDTSLPPPPSDGYVVRAFLWHPCPEDEEEEEDSEKARIMRKHANGKLSTALVSNQTAEEEMASLPEKHRKTLSKLHKRGKKGAKSLLCPATPVKMREICPEYECSMRLFREKMESKIRKTGTWDKLCGVEKFNTVLADVREVHAALERQMDEHQIQLHQTQADKQQNDGSTSSAQQQPNTQSQQPNTDTVPDVPEAEQSSVLVSPMEEPAPFKHSPSSSSHPLAILSLIALFILPTSVGGWYFYQRVWKERQRQRSEDSHDMHSMRDDQWLNIDDDEESAPFNGNIDRHAAANQRFDDQPVQRIY